MIEGAAQGDHGVDIADEDATRRFFARVQSYRDAVERRRFGGENPDVQPARRRPQPVETAAAAIAAERLHGVLNLNGERVSTGEDLAVGQLDAALRALATWDFALASQCLDTAAALARVPRIQQQVSLVRGLAGVAGAMLSSTQRHVPTGPLIVVFVSALVVVSLLFAPNRGMVWAWFTRRRRRRVLLEAMAAADAAHGGPRLFPGEEPR